MHRGNEECCRRFIDNSASVKSTLFWAQKNPDSIKNLWLEAPRPAEDIEVNWDNYGVRIIIIAPSIERSTLELVNTINYQVDLIEIKRWVEGQNQVLACKQAGAGRKVKRQRL